MKLVERASIPGVLKLWLLFLCCNTPNMHVALCFTVYLLVLKGDKTSAERTSVFFLWASAHRVLPEISNIWSFNPQL